MPRYIMNQQTKQQSQVELSLQAKPLPKTKTKLNQMQIERVLNRKRSSEYMDAIARMDAGGHVHNQHMVDALIQAIQNELPEIEIDLGPQGIVSKCYLGAPYEVHTLDVTDKIIEHYESYRKMPALLETARGLAKSGHYAFIEVYPNALRAVKEDGTVATIKE